MAKLGLRVYLVLNAGLNCLAYSATNHWTGDNFATASVLAAILAPILLLPVALWRLAFRPRQRPGSGLDRVLSRFPTGDSFYLRHLLTSLCIFGIIGSGKSSSSGLFFARLVLRIRSSGLILASNPDDAKWWLARFREAGRLDDLIIFSPKGENKWNFLATLQKEADAREMTQFLVIASETLAESKGKDEIYWKQLSERLLFNIISALMLAKMPVSAGAIANFLSSTPRAAAQLATEEYKKGFCSQTLARAKAAAQGDVELGDYAMIHNYFLGSFLHLDERPRSSAISAVENITHCLSVGYARELFSTTTTASCADLLAGKWILLDFPVSAGGPTSKLIYSLAKLEVQKQVLKNDWTPDQPVTVIWSDECWHVVNSGDRDFLAESRKHGGILVFLTQSVTNFNIALGGDDLGQQRASSLLGMMGTLVLHASDMATAKYVVELMGETEQEEIGGSYTPPGELAGTLSGQAQWSGNFNRRRLSVLMSRQLTSGMRMGGKSKTVDGWVYRPELFASGSNIQLMQFYQD